MEGDSYLAAPTVARMAAVAGLTPARLRATGRDDTARLLAAQGGTLDELRRIRALDSDRARELLALVTGVLFDSVAGEAGAGPGEVPENDSADEPGYGTTQGHRTRAQGRGNP